MFVRVPLDGQRDDVLRLGLHNPLTSAVLVRVRVLGVRCVQGASLVLLRLLHELITSESWLAASWKQTLDLAIQHRSLRKKQKHTMPRHVLMLLLLH